MAFRLSAPKATSTLLAHRRYSTDAWLAPLAISDRLVQHKSAFQAYATTLALHTAMTPAEESDVPRHMKKTTMPQLIAHIGNLHPHTRRASHAMYAWRLRAPPSALSGSANGGEAGAGERLERLLQRSGGVDDVAVVVFRWHGGVPLGPARWRCISSVAKEALERGGFVRAGGESDAQHGSRGGRGKRGM